MGAEYSREEAPEIRFALFGKKPTAEQDAELAALMTELENLDPMDKMSMGGACEDQTDRMKAFLAEAFGKESLPSHFVQGVRAFKLNRPPSSQDPDAVVSLEGKYAMTIREVGAWQDSYRVFADRAMYVDSAGQSEADARDEIRRCLSGHSAPNMEAWRMKFAMRVSQNPIFMEFDGKTITRRTGEATGTVWLVSTCGVDFACRHHDTEDIKMYIRNWREIFRCDGDTILNHGRELLITRPGAGDLDEARFLADSKRMARARLRVQDRLGVQVVVEVGIGLGVFAGERLGIHNRVRDLTALALRQTLEEIGGEFEHIKLVICALPIMSAGYRDNMHHYHEVFSGAPRARKRPAPAPAPAPEGAEAPSSEGEAEIAMPRTPYNGPVPLALVDSDMHKIARTAALRAGPGGVEARFVVGELNPGDSHGVMGEYWENYGPGTEEKLALTTAALLTQHHAINPRVLDPERYDFL
eukprot:gnl/Trimastix_PCT/1166.p1 GENE.gnl/Trimastix_PCT/1166~~gnl/Trimastix_PCT/1166.p1  ORF type:complete len:478 (+),score=137.52 gnl/Trimastix_PCT/1166:27-1436(+)